MATYVSKEQYLAACTSNLYVWLLMNHPGEVVQKYGSVLLRADAHISVKKGYSGYMNFRTGESGNAVDYLMEFLGYSYPEAVRALTEGIDSGLHDRNSFCDIFDAMKTNQFSSASSEKNTLETMESAAAPSITLQITPPEAAAHTRNVYAFLTRTRGLPADIVQKLISDGLLYQSMAGNNAIFINPEHDYFEIRGTNTIADKRCRHRDTCSKSRPGKYGWCDSAEICTRYRPSPFHGSSRNQGSRFWYFKPSEHPTDTIYLCESAIDAISLYVLHRNKGHVENAVYVSIGGAAKQAVINRIKKQHSHVVIATDNDEAGDECRLRNSELETIRPIHKDWNEDLIKHTMR